MPKLITKSIITPQGLTELSFEPLTIGGETIFAVYCDYGAHWYCFHMAVDADTTNFKIMDKHNCPYDLHELEEMLSDTLYALGDE